MGVSPFGPGHTSLDLPNTFPHINLHHQIPYQLSHLALPPSRTFSSPATQVRILHFLVTRDDFAFFSFFFLAFPIVIFITTVFLLASKRRLFSTGAVTCSETTDRVASLLSLTRPTNPDWFFPPSRCTSIATLDHANISHTLTATLSISTNPVLPTV